jgi:biotin transporter BioY
LRRVDGAGGYLWGFVLSAAVVGALPEQRWDRSSGARSGRCS